MTPNSRVLLASATLLAMTGFNPPTQASTVPPILLAQATPAGAGAATHEKEKLKKQKKAHPQKPSAHAPARKPTIAQERKRPSGHAQATHPTVKNATQHSTPAANPSKTKNHLGERSKPAAIEAGRNHSEKRRQSSQPVVPSKHPITQSHSKPRLGPVTSTQRKPGTSAPTVTKSPQARVPSRAVQQRPANRAAIAQPTHPRDASEFIRRAGQKPTRGLADLHRERRETRQGNRVFIHEGDRTIVRSGNRVIIRHSEAQRFAVGARNVHIDHRGDQSISVFVRPDGVRIINVTDREGHLIRRLRRDPDGREIVIIDNGWAEAQPIFIDLPPPIVHIPRDRYIIDEDRADPDRIYRVFSEGPIERLDRRYTLEQVRYSHSLREYMPRVDLDINFDTGSWQLTPDQIGRLNIIAHALNRAIRRNPREVFLIEGHTDAVGTPEDNLSLSDRRAEAVAVALTEEFGVPPENLVSQGYGEQDLKVQTLGPERANRRVSVRRITPLIDQAVR